MSAPSGGVGSIGTSGGVGRTGASPTAAATEVAGQRRNRQGRLAVILKQRRDMLKGVSDGMNSMLGGT